MRLIKCKNGHIYDADKLNNCPHCDGVVKNLEQTADTYGKGQSDVPTVVSKKKGNEGNGELETRRQVGLLVAVEGCYTGKTFVIYEGTTRIGRAGNLEISLPLDDAVSGKGHAEILFENGCFELTPLNTSRTVKHNGESISETVRLKDRDIIELGESKFAFVRFDDIY